jgi:hypothetical protein
MRALKVWTLLGLCWLLASCNPETDLQKDRTSAAGTEGGDGQLSGSSNSPLSGQLVDPATGTSELPTNLATVVLAFPEAVAVVGEGPGVWLYPAGAGGPVALGWGGEIPCSAKCYAFAPAVELTASTVYTVRVPAGGLQLLDGKPVPAADVGGFTTGVAPDLFAPRVQSFTMQIAEGCATVHLAADEQVRAEIVISSNGVDATLASTSAGLVVDFSQRLPDFPADLHARAVAHVSDRSGNQGVSTPLSVALPAPVPRLVITEVLANPAGSEATQEFVEIHNAGDTAVELAGWAIEDKTGKDVLPEAVLLPGQYGLIVGDTYAADDGKDPAPAETTVLVHVPGRIGGDGLSNSGEVVRLLAPEGQAGPVVSQYGGWVDVSATAWSGKSTRRASLEACDGVDAWSKAPASPTPGW